MQKKMLHQLSNSISVIVLPSFRLRRASLQIVPVSPLFFNGFKTVNRSSLLQNVYDDDMLTQLASAVSSLYLWPNPVGRYAADTLHLIAREQRSPGESNVFHSTTWPECAMGPVSVPRFYGRLSADDSW